MFVKARDPPQSFSLDTMYFFFCLFMQGRLLARNLPSSLDGLSIEAPEILLSPVA